MRIIRFEAEHIKKIQIVEITPSGHVVEISGKNGAGKTSILDSIWWALAGTRTHQPDPIQHGHDKGRIKLDLGAITVEREFKRQKAAPGKQDERITTRLAVKTAEGQVMQSPQMILDSLLGSLSFDPLAFARKSAAEQYQALQAACGVDLQTIDRQNEADFLARTIANRTAKEKRAAAAQIDVPEQIPERIDVAELIEERKRREKFNGERAEALGWRKALEQKIEAVTLEKTALSEKLEACELQAAVLRADLDVLPPLPGQEVFSDIDEKLAKSRAVNDAAHEAERLTADAKRLAQEVSAAEDESRELTSAMEAAQTSRCRSGREGRAAHSGLESRKRSSLAGRRAFWAGIGRRATPGLLRDCHAG